MKLSNREKVLLIVLGIALIGFLYYSYVLTPELKEIARLKDEVKSCQIKVDSVKIQSSPNNKIFQDYKILNTKIAVESLRLFPSIMQEKIILNLEDMLDRSKLDAVNMSYSLPRLGSVNEETKKDDQEENTANDLVQQFIQKLQPQKSAPPPANTANKNNTPAADAETPYKVSKMTSNIHFKGSYYNVFSILQYVELSDKKILVRSINMKRLAGGLLEGDIALEFYAIPKMPPLDLTDKEYLSWDLYGQYGKENPFEAFAGYVEQQILDSAGMPSNGAAQPQNAMSVVYVNDFAMTVQPTSSDVPTVVLGKVRDNNNKNCVFADNPNTETVELQVLQSEGKYYYKFKTQTDSFPKNYKTDMVEFTPASPHGIRFNIVSSKRNGTSDQSGVRLTVINKTDLPMEIRVVNDDAKTPRIRFDRKIGNIIINQ